LGWKIDTIMETFGSDCEDYLTALFRRSLSPGVFSGDVPYVVSYRVMYALWRRDGSMRVPRKVKKRRVGTRDMRRLG